MIFDTTMINKSSKLLYVCLFILCMSFVTAQHISIDMDDNAYGWINIEKDIVVFRPSMHDTYQEFMFTAMHEYGHIIWMNLSSSEKKLYEAIYNDAHEFPTDYAKQCQLYIKGCVDYEEDFADSFASALSYTLHYDAILGEREFFFQEFVKI